MAVLVVGVAEAGGNLQVGIVGYYTPLRYVGDTSRFCVLILLNAMSEGQAIILRNEDIRAEIGGKRQHCGGEQFQTRGRPEDKRK